MTPVMEEPSPRPHLVKGSAPTPSCWDQDSHLWTSERLTAACKPYHGTIVCWSRLTFSVPKSCFLSAYPLPDLPLVLWIFWAQWSCCLFLRCDSTSSGLVTSPPLCLCWTSFWTLSQSVLSKVSLTTLAMSFEVLYYTCASWRPAHIDPAEGGHDLCLTNSLKTKQFEAMSRQPKNHDFFPPLSSCKGSSLPKRVSKKCIVQNTSKQNYL